MPAVIMFHGNPLMVDYTPGSDVAAGDVVELGDVPFIAHNKISANELGALAAGGGVYKATSDGSVDNPGVKIYWDNSTEKVTTTATLLPNVFLSNLQQADALVLVEPYGGSFVDPPDPRLDQLAATMRDLAPSIRSFLMAGRPVVVMDGDLSSTPGASGSTRW